MSGNVGRKIMREVQRALLLHGLARKPLPCLTKGRELDFAFMREAYRELDDLGADRWLLAVIGAWGAELDDNETLEMLQSMNDNTFADQLHAVASSDPQLQADMEEWDAESIHREDAAPQRRH
jgi:hypothetical protein